ncbi:cupin-like domain-containing protein [Microbulbifer bruguierae]|uniref:Cupin-like domain-containing protein n=1 Tax=Microbulbifer bruguierae TaxID=3029061 RepID=A0ABY8NCW1_9GAMM|nr:cupin-like domain-containing protein [Microbulbifer bruguierae]WGL16437.1 cupin-like domain-containing protein [Microbulbifer bruguierae]
MQSIEIVDRFQRDFFESEVVPAYRPVIFKDAVSHWPLVQQARKSSVDLMAFLEARATPGKIWTIEAPRDSGGRFFYSADGCGFNFERKITTFQHFSQRLKNWVDDQHAPALSMQSAFVDEHFYDVRESHSIPVFSSDIRPRIWIGNRSVVATHYDHSENIACVAAGRRRFTLFPPHQISNLYLGPLDKTIGGSPVSMVSLLSPDFDRYPRFEEALKHALVAELEPGDVIYIPTLWFHHVEALEGINILVNFWRSSGGAASGPRPADALLLALLTIQDQPPSIKAAWKSFFDYYVFDTFGDPSAHLPEELKGMLGGMDPDMAMKLRRWLVRQLSEAGE